MDSNEYKITYDVADEGAYCEGFADGYAKAWKDCWSYVHALIERKAQDQSKPDTALREEVERE